MVPFFRSVMDARTVMPHLEEEERYHDRRGDDRDGQARTARQKIDKRHQQHDTGEDDETTPNACVLHAAHLRFGLSSCLRGGSGTEDGSFFVVPEVAGTYD